jgi:thioesterase domain-containing protein
MADATADALTRYLHDHIPLTRHMGIVVTEPGPDRVVLSAPLAPNVNHRETAFGGSLSGAAILAGWTLLHVRLTPRARRHRLVVQESTTHFEQPADGPFEAVCELPSAAEFERFAVMLERRGKARIALESRILCRGEVSARHTGRYVALDAH